MRKQTVLNTYCQDIFLEKTVTLQIPLESGSGTYSYDTPKEDSYDNVFTLSACVMGLAALCAMGISGHFKPINLLWQWYLRKHQEKQEPELEDIVLETVVKTVVADSKKEDTVVN